MASLITVGAWAAATDRDSHPPAAPADALSMFPPAAHSAPQEHWDADRERVPGHCRAGWAGLSGYPPSRQLAQAAVAVQPAFAACRRGALAILREVARIIRCTAAPVAALAAPAPRLDGPLPVIGEIARTFLTADTARPCGFFTVQRKVAAIGNVSRF